MCKLPKVFSDASIQENKVVIGVYSEDLQIKYKYVVYNKRMSIHVAEELALKTAMHLAKDTKCHFFVDNQYVADKYRGIAYWIPREFNKQADALTKTTGTSLGPTSIATYIQTNYSTQQKIKLIAAILGLSKLSTIGTLAKNKMACRLMQTLLLKHEKPAQSKKAISSAALLKQKELLHLIKTYQNGSIATV